MESMTQNSPARPPPTTASPQSQSQQARSPRLDPSSTSSFTTRRASRDGTSYKKDRSNNDSFNVHNNERRNRRRAQLNSDNVSSDNTSTSNSNKNNNAQDVSAVSSSSEIDLETTHNDNNNNNNNINNNKSENKKLTVVAVSSNSSSPTLSAPASKPKTRSTKTTATGTRDANNEQSSTPTTQRFNTPHNKTTKEDEELFGNKTIPPTLQSSSSSSGKTTEGSSYSNNNPGQNKTEKVPKSSLRKTSSTRSALSLVFDISQNQTITRSNSATSSRCESRQGKYHTECQPVNDPDLKVENWARVRSARSPRGRSSISTRAGSEVNLLGRRESVTNLIFAGQSQIDGDEGGLEAIYWKKLQLQCTPRSSLLFNRMATSLKGSDVTPGDFNVMVDEDYSLSRLSKVNTPTSSTGSRSSRSTPRSRTGFLYQVTDFDRISKDVPAFVRHYTQKNGKMITESFILRLNYLRRRRQLGENSSTINIGNSNNSNNNGHHHGHAPSHNTGNLNNAGKRSSPTAV